MKKIRIGVICPSEIAFRRFMPALAESNFEYAGVAFASEEEWGGVYTEQMKESELKKCEKFKETYGGEIYNSYNLLIEDESVDAVYLPLPPALHYEWGKKVVDAGKHIFLEKPSCVSAEQTSSLIELAKNKNLAVHENYMFAFHSQIDYIFESIKSNKVGDLRLFRIAFGFPKRAANDFRYNKQLGGGALLDAGGYTVKLATMLLGDSARVVTSRLNYIEEFDVDIFGSVTMENDDGLTAQLSFGMDNSYKCDLEIWGSQGAMFFNRILTAPVGFEPVVEYKNASGASEKIVLKSDDTFLKSLMHFEKCITDEECRCKTYAAIARQAELIDCIKGE